MSQVTHLHTPAAHVAVVNGLRGLAALWVCWYHVTGLIQPAASAFATLGRYGFMGVQVFFVVSGFVIPHALHRAHYQLPQFPRFLAKRLLRLHPPYLAVVATIALSLWIGRLTSLNATNFTWPQLLAHLAYLNPFLHQPWFLESFWTLAVEFQYYLSIGLLFRWIARPGWIPAIAIAALSGAASLLLPAGAYLPHHLPFFAMGIAVFRRLSLKAPLAETLLILAISALFAQTAHAWIAATIALGTALAILFVPYTNRALDALGDLSYSLYLTHPLSASFAVTLVASTPLALAACLIGAWPLYRFVEIPSKRWSARVSYRP
ncbi:MAG: hypothetical protein RL328_2602 [Acidobacteriota bacterium]